MNMIHRLGTTLFAIVWLALGARAATNVFDLPLAQSRHRHLQQQLIQAVRAGRIADMEAISREGVALLPLDPIWRYNLACALAYRADKQEALETLEQAIHLGFRDVAFMRADKDMKLLADLPAFKALMEKAEQLAGQPTSGLPAAKPSTVVMGLPVQVHATNTLWDFEAGFFKLLVNLIRPDLKRIGEYAAEYRGPAAERVRAWMEQDQASGNFGDLYVNRDDGHSKLDVSLFPGLSPVVYGEEARQRDVHLSLPNMLFDYPVLGNASMSVVSGPFWRSLPRAVLTDPFQPVAAFQLYVSNQIWFYPSHRDHDPKDGDLYPANTPYYVISQGSSYTDQPFMQAFAAALASLRPDTKRALTARRHLAPMLQMVFRATQKSVLRPDDYLTGLAHPVVFNPVNLDVEAMVTLANSLRPETLPPLVLLRTVQDMPAEAGIDFFDLRGEGLFDTPFAIARVVRGVARTRRMTIEAVLSDGSRETPLIWRVLQGDPDKIRITPLDARASRVEIEVDYHGVYRPRDARGDLAPLSASRVDIGCFAQAGDLYSPPAFVSFYCLPNEERVYHEDGRILSIDYRNPARRYADPALTLHKGWKDLYSYDDAGRLRGWFRMRGDGQAPERFTWQGHKTLETDAKDRPVRAVAVQYLPRQTGPDLPPTLAWTETGKILLYTYADDSDLIGQSRAVE